MTAQIQPIPLTDPLEDLMEANWKLVARHHNSNAFVMVYGLTFPRIMRGILVFDWLNDLRDYSGRWVLATQWAKVDIRPLWATL